MEMTRFQGFFHKFPSIYEVLVVFGGFLVKNAVIFTKKRLFWVNFSEKRSKKPRKCLK